MADNGHDTFSERPRSDTAAVRLVGKKTGQYEIVEFLARGGMGELYRVRHQLLRRESVMKTIRPEPGTASEVLDRFLREIRLGAMLMHPNIILFHDAGVEKGFCYLVMEYFESRDLGKRFLGSPAPIDSVAHIGTQLTSALAAAHADGILHRDIKPQNVLMNGRGVIKVCDFGLAKALGNPAFKSITTHDRVLGSPAFMAPENLLGAGSITARTDIYGVGTVLYFCLTGRGPFSGRNPVEVVRQIGGPFPHPSELRADVPPELERVVLTAMDPDPEKRYETIQDMRAALESDNVLKGTVGAAAHSLTGDTELIASKTKTKQPYLRVFGLNQGCCEYVLVHREHLVGRAENADLRLEHETVSRQHAVLRPEGDSFRLLDSGSRAGVFVNGEPVEQKILHPGDTVRITHFLLEYHNDDKTIAGGLETDPMSSAILREPYGLLPESMHLRYRLVHCPPETIFRPGVGHRVGHGGLLVLADNPDELEEETVCIEIELTWPDGHQRNFFGKLVGLVQGRNERFMCLKLYRVEPESREELITYCLCGKWRKARDL